jgi:hypothetical protein
MIRQTVYTNLSVKSKPGAIQGRKTTGPHEEDSRVAEKRAHNSGFTLKMTSMRRGLRATKAYRQYVEEPKTNPRG